MPTRLARLLNNLRALMRGRRRDDVELSDELRAYLDAAIDARVAAGMTRADAERVARVELGSALAIRDRVRDVGWEIWIDELWRDVRYAARRLRATPGFSIAAILTLALGIGINTALFSVADAALFKRLPYKDPQQLVDFEYVLRRGTAEETRQLGVTWRQLDGWRTQTQLFAGIETFGSPQSAAIDEGGVSDATRVARISPGLTALLGVSPILGRTFGTADVRPDPQVALLGETYWRRAHHADPNILGRTVTVDGRPLAVIGVLPRTLSWWVEGRKVAVWLPLDEAAARVAGSSPFVSTVARLNPGLTFEQAQRETKIAGAMLAGRDRTFGDVELAPIDEFRLSGFSNPAIAIKAVFAGSVLVLLISCANVANLLLTRNLTRRREMALRLALGAGRRRLVRQLSLEGAWLAFAGGGVAWLLARWSMTMLPVLIPENLGLFEANALALDGRSLLFCALAIAITGAGCGFAPAVQGSRHDTRALHDAPQRIVGHSQRGRRMSHALQSAQVALTLVLLTGAALLTTSFVRMIRSEMGYDVDRLVSATLSPRARADLDVSAADALYADLLDRVRHLPGVRAAYGHPPPNAFYGRMTRYGAENQSSDAAAPILAAYWIDPEYLALAGIRLEAGRAFTPADRDGSAPVALIDRHAASTYWPTGNAIGQRFRISPYMPWVTVVGIVGHVKTRDFTSSIGAVETFFPLAQAEREQRVHRTLLIRSPGDPRDVFASIQTLVRGTTPSLSIRELAVVSDLYGPTFATPRLTLIVMSLFAVLALLTASIGLYGVLNHAVRERTNEIGVRMALGARTAHLCRLVVGDALTPVVAGLVIGLVATSWLSRLLTSLLFEVTPHDPWSLSAAVIVLIAVSIAAALVPARRATRVDPVIALRAE